MGMTSKIGIGIIGNGFSAKTFHLPFLNVLEPFEVRKIFTRQTGESLEHFLNDQAIDLVVITSPNNLHFDHAYAALKHQKHVVVEKPFVLAEAEGKTLIDLAAQQQKILTVYHNRRWDSDFLTIQKLIQERSLGEIFYFESRYDRFCPDVKNRWKENESPGSGILWDLGAHLIDQAVLLFGLPTQVFADCAHQRPGAKTIDYFKVLLSYPSGLKVSLGASNLCLNPGPRFVVHGTRGSFVKSGVDPQETDLMQNGYKQSSDWGREQTKKHGTLTILDDEGRSQTSSVISEQGKYQEFYELLAQSIKGQAHAPVDPTSNLNVIRLITLCYQSAAQKKQLEIRNYP